MKRINILFVICLFTITLFAEIPAGYYHKADGKKGYELLNTLNEICSNGTFLKYGSGEGYTWEGFHYTDCNADGSVIDMYSSEIRYQTEFNSVSGMHIEHSLPKSWWGGLENYAYRDLHHLFPADSKTNITKSNLPLGVVVNASFDNGVSKIGTTTLYNGKVKCFEPADEYKGDFARAYLYISTTYNELSDIWDSHMMQNNTYPVWTNEAIDLLLKWHREDPVSEKEIKRQEAVYQIQHNRNPFIDYPEMVEHIWGNKKNEGLNLNDEERPALLTPTAWTEIDIPLTYIGTTATKILRFEGINYTENLTLALVNNSQEITLSKKAITPEELTNGYDLTISISCNEVKTVFDTLLINTTDTIRLAIAATFTDEFMITNVNVINPTTTNIEWTQTPNTNKYEVILSDKPNNRTTDLIFSAYVEGSSYNKAVSIYNGTGQTVDLKYYSLRKQGNGTGDWKLDYPLSGTLNHGKCYVIVSNRAGDELKAMADTLVKSPIDQDNILNFNGNDAMALYHNNILIDVIGEVDNSSDWGKDVSLKRKAKILASNTNFDWEEWTKYEKDDFSHLSTHSATFTSNAKILKSYQSANNYITIDDLTPNKVYYAEVKAGNTSTTNLLTFVMPNIDAPEAYEATNIYANQFTANWDEVSYADGYVVELIQEIGSSVITIEENFNSVSSNGKPLPEGWSGTASGNYTTAASSGKAPNSIALKNNGEYIQTPTTPYPITDVEFMYRFPSTSATDSYFIVYSVDSQGNLNQIDKIEYTNTTKTTLRYSDLQDTYAIRIEYHKVAGNLAIDDVIYKYGGKTNNIIESAETTNNFYVFENLTANTEYMYQVKAMVGDECLSDASNIVMVKTNNNYIITNIDNNSDLLFYTSDNTLYIEGLSANSTVTIYNISGIKIHQTALNFFAKGSKTFGSQLSTFNFQLSKGVYIAQITNNKDIETFKFVIR